MASKEGPDLPLRSTWNVPAGAGTDGGGDPAVSRRVTSVRVPARGPRGLRAGAVRAHADRARLCDRIRRQRRRYVRRERSLPPLSLLPGAATAPTAPRPRDDLHADRRHVHAVRVSRPPSGLAGSDPRDRVGRRAARDRRPLVLARPAGLARRRPRRCARLDRSGRLPADRRPNRRPRLCSARGRWARIHDRRDRVCAGASRPRAARLRLSRGLSRTRRVRGRLPVLDDCVLRLAASVTSVVGGQLRVHARGAAILATTLRVPGIQAVERLGRAPSIEETTHTGVATTVLSPGTRPPWPALVFVNGATPDGRRHPIVRRLGLGLARAGFLVYVPELPGIGRGELTPTTLQSTIEVVTAAADTPEASLGRVGLAGVSIGGSLALLTAAAP